MMSLPKLYGHDKKQGVKVWYVTTDGGSITVYYGKDGGTISTQTTVCEPKNVGRANESTAEQQATAEAQSKWNKQVKRGYVQDKNNITTNTLPPLAKKYQDAGHQLSWPLDVLPKLNGVRCTAYIKDGDIVFQSRGGDPFPYLEHLVEELNSCFFSSNPRYYVDFELYCHGMYLEDIISAVKKHNANTPKLEAWIFDLYDPAKPDQIWGDRYATYVDQLYQSGVKEAPKMVFGVGATCFGNEGDMIAHHDKLVALGYEGVVLRPTNGLFKFSQRSTDFQKYKVAMSEEFKVVDILVDKNGGGIPVCEVMTNAGMQEFKATFAATHERRKELFENKEDYKGLWLTVDFESYSKYGKPAKPIGKSFRGMDSEGNVTE